MKTKQGAMFQSLRAVQGFLDEHAEKLADVNNTGARKRLDEAITALDTHRSDQAGSKLTSEGLTQRQRALRVALLRDHMSAVARVARADLPNTPEFSPLRMPRGKPTPERLAAAATGMAQVAANYQDTFIAAGVPTDFVDQINTTAQSMISTISDRTRVRGRQRGATVSMVEELRAGRKVVAVLDAFVKTALKDDVGLLANWSIVRRVPRLAARSQAASPILS